MRRTLNEHFLDRLLAAVTKHKVGKRVKTPIGHGHIVSVHTNQTFCGVHTGNGTSFFPANQVTDPDHDGDNDAPGGAGDTDHDAPATPA